MANPGVEVADGAGHTDGENGEGDKAAVEVGEEVGAGDLVKEEEGEADVVDEAVGLLQKRRIDEAEAAQPGAEGHDEKDR